MIQLPLPTPEAPGIIMTSSTYRRPFKRIITVVVLLSIIISLAGCGYFGFCVRKAHWKTTFENIPSMSALNQVAPEDSLILVGSLVKLQKRQEPLLLVAVSNRYRRNEKVVLVQLPASADAYTAFLPKGEYELFVFADLDQDGDFEGEELVGRASVNVNSEHSKGGAIVEGPLLTVDFEHPGETDFRVHEKVRPASFVYASLDDEFFDPQYGPLGLYNPSELMAHTQGFIFGLEGYESRNGDKTVVLFIHGISGTPRDWKFMVDGMDRSRFQPIFFYYPSGLPLDKLGAVLAETIAAIGKSSKNSGHKIVLAAHSMGGLVALSAIHKLSEEGLLPALKMYCSFSTPYGGDEAARKGIEIAPVVVPVWRDIAAESDFLKGLANKPFPKTLPFYLYFSYNDSSKFKYGESSDGAVTLRSQLAPSLQAAATRVFGFNETHVGILNSAEARASFLRLLDTITPPLPGVEATDSSGLAASATSAVK